MDATQSFNDVLSNVSGGFQKVPAPPSMKPYEDKIKGEMGEQSKLITDVSKFKTPEPPPPTPLPKPIEEQYSNPFDAFKSVVPVFAIFASLATRKPLQTAMTSMAASMDAFHKGETDKFEQERKNAKEQMDYALSTNKQNSEYYNAVINKENMDIGQKEALIKAHATLAEDWRVMAGLNESGYKGAVEAIKANNEIHEKALTVAEKIFKDQGGTGGGKYDFANFQDADLVPGTGLTKASLKQKVEGLHKGASYSDVGLSMRTTKNPQKDAVDQLRAEMYPDDDIASSKLSYGGQKAEKSAIGRRAGTTEVGVGEFDQLIEPTRESIHKLDMGKYKDLNSFTAAFDEHVNDPDYIEAYNNIQELQNAYTSVLTRGGVRSDAAQGLSEKTINTLFGSAGSDRALDTMAANTKRIMKGIEKAKDGTVGKPDIADVMNDSGSKDYPLPLPKGNSFEKGKWYTGPSGEVGKYTGEKNGQHVFE